MAFDFPKRMLGSVLSPGGNRGRLNILIYHRVRPGNEKFNLGDPDEHQFRWQMHVLKTYFSVVPLDRAISMLRENRLPSRAACITFDDGYADNAEIALPILKSLELTATFFIATGYLNGGCMWNDKIIEACRSLEEGIVDLNGINLGEYMISNPISKMEMAKNILNKVKYMPPDTREITADKIQTLLEKDAPKDLMMTDENIQRLHSEGMSIGAHTVSHPILANITDEQAWHEITESRKRLKEIIGQEITLFAYPNGIPQKDYTDSHVKIIKDEGFHGAVSTKWGVSTGKSDVMQLPRFTPWDRTRTKYLLRLYKNYLNKTH